MRAGGAPEPSWDARLPRGLFCDQRKLAKVDRAELNATTATHVQANFRSWRDSGLTWLARTGLGVDKISRRAGHDMIQTTMGYVKQAEDLTGDLGVPFGPLPDDLVAGSVTSLGAEQLLPSRTESGSVSLGEGGAASRALGTDDEAPSSRSVDDQARRDISEPS